MTQEDVAKRIMLFGALFEAEAHIYICLSGKVRSCQWNFIVRQRHGFSRSSATVLRLQYSEKRFAVYVGTQHSQFKGWTESQLAALATLVACDYINQLPRVGWKLGIQHVMKWTKACEKKDRIQLTFAT